MKSQQLVAAINPKPRSIIRDKQDKIAMAPTKSPNKTHQPGVAIGPDSSDSDLRDNCHENTMVAPNQTMMVPTKCPVKDHKPDLPMGPECLSGIYDYDQFFVPGARQQARDKAEYGNNNDLLAIDRFRKETNLAMWEDDVKQILGPLAELGVVAQTNDNSFSFADLYDSKTTVMMNKVDDELQWVGLFEEQQKLDGTYTVPLTAVDFVPAGAAGLYRSEPKVQQSVPAPTLPPRRIKRFKYLDEAVLNWLKDVGPDQEVH